MRRRLGPLVAILVGALSATGALEAAENAGAKACLTDPSPDKRITSCSKLIEAHPKQDSSIAWIFAQRGNAYFVKGQVDKAIQDYDSAVALDPTNDTALANRGIAHLTQGKADLAMNDYTAALRANPKNANSYNLRGLLYFRSGKLDLAIQDYTSAIKYDPGFVDAYIDRGYARYAAKAYDSAILDFNAAAKLAPKNPLPVYLRSLAARQLGNKAQADQDLAAARKLDPQIEGKMKALGVQ